MVPNILEIFIYLESYHVNQTAICIIIFIKKKNIISQIVPIMFTFICLILISFINKVDIKKSFLRSSLSWFINESHDEVFTVKSVFQSFPFLRVSQNTQKYTYVQVSTNMNELVLLFLFLLQCFQYSHGSVD